MEGTSFHLLLIMSTLGDIASVDRFVNQLQLAWSIKHGRGLESLLPYLS